MQMDPSTVKTHYKFTPQDSELLVLIKKRVACFHLMSSNACMKMKKPSNTPPGIGLRRLKREVANSDYRHFPLENPLKGGQSPFSYDSYTRILPLIPILLLSIYAIYGIRMPWTILERISFQRQTRENVEISAYLKNPLFYWIEHLQLSNQRNCVFPCRHEHAAMSREDQKMAGTSIFPTGCKS